jgi:protein-histidine N-methyltransferase
MSTMNVNKMILNGDYLNALIIVENQSTTTQHDMDKKVCNLSYIYYLMGNYENAKKVILNVLMDRNDVWHRLYYRLAKAYEGLQQYDEMCEAYKNMYKLLSDFEREKSTKHMQDYYNRDILFMKQWLILNGGKINNLNIEYYDVDYRGMVAASKVKPKEKLIQVPWNCIISLNDSKINNPYVQQIIKANVTISSTHSYLAINLIYLRQNNGFNMPYIRCLPKYFSNVPINFTIEELEKMEGSYALVRIIQKLMLLKVEYSEITNAFPEGCPFTFADFVWARTAVITRVYAIKRNNETDNVLVPFADMANHETPPNTKWWFDEQEKMFTIESENYMDIGDVLYETYGYKCNYRYLVNYGFTVNNNKHEEVVINTNYTLSSIVNTYITNILNYEDKQTLIRDLFDNIIYEKTSDQLKNLILTEKSCYQIGYTYNDATIKMFNELRAEQKNSKETELSIMELLSAVIGYSLSRFVTSVQNDEQQLELYDYDFNMRNTIIMRKEEKKVLIFWQELVNAIIDRLKSSEPQKIVSRKMHKKLTKWDIKSFTPYFKYLDELQ